MPNDFSGFTSEEFFGVFRNDHIDVDMIAEKCDLYGSVPRLMIIKKLYKWRDGVKTHRRVELMQSVLQANPSYHWSEGARGEILFYDTEGDRAGRNILKITSGLSLKAM